MALVERNILQLDLYHGTRSLHLSSIRKYGLNGRDLIADLGVIVYFKDLYSLAEQILSDEDEQWIIAKTAFEWMVNQRVTAAGFNFRHGKTYLTPSKRTAINYALNNPQGSELISNAKLLYDLVASRDPGAVADIEGRNPALHELFQHAGKPMVIQLSQVPLAMLRSESGLSAEKVVRELEQLMAAFADRKIVEETCQQCNFELHGTVPFDSLLCYYVSALKDGRNELIRMDANTA